MATPAAASSCSVVLGSAIAKSLLKEVAAGLTLLKNKPRLVGVLANEDPAAKMYADWSAKTCKQNGFDFDLITIHRDDLGTTITKLNNDPACNSIIIYYPIFPTTAEDRKIKELLLLSKDVEGLSRTYLTNLYQNIRHLDPPTNSLKSILPCTPLAAVKVLEHLHIYNPILPYGNRLHGRTITVINRSEVVGRPLAALLANDGACVYSVDVADVQRFTRGQGIRLVKHAVEELPGWELKDCLPLSDVVISGVPGDKFKVPTELIRDGAVCVNFSSEKNFVAADVKAKASIYVPAIGAVTIAVLLRNLLRLVQNQEAQKKTEEEGNAVTEAASS